MCNISWPWCVLPLYKYNWTIIVLMYYIPKQYDVYMYYPSWTNLQSRWWGVHELFFLFFTVISTNQNKQKCLDVFLVISLTTTPSANKAGIKILKSVSICLCSHPCCEYICLAQYIVSCPWAVTRCRQQTSGPWTKFWSTFWLDRSLQFWVFTFKGRAVGRLNAGETEFSSFCLMSSDAKEHIRDTRERQWERESFFFFFKAITKKPLHVMYAYNIYICI